MKMGWKRRRMRYGKQHKRKKRRGRMGCEELREREIGETAGYETAQALYSKNKSKRKKK